MNLDVCIWLSQLQHSEPGPVRDTKLDQSVDSNEKWRLNVFRNQPVVYRMHEVSCETSRGVGSSCLQVAQKHLWDKEGSTDQLSAGCVKSAMCREGRTAQLSAGSEKSVVGQGVEYRPCVYSMRELSCEQGG